MLYKSRAFNAFLYDNIGKITRNTYYFQRVRTKGKYSRSPDGQIITDIDIEAHAEFGNTLLKDLVTLLTRIQHNKNMILFKFSFGIFREHEIPWSIIDGKVQYNKTDALYWLSNITRDCLIPTVTLSRVKNLIDKDQEITIQDLELISSLVYSYIEIRWTLEDINRGYILHNNKEYDILEIMKTSPPILEVGLLYQSEIVSLDFAVIDREYRNVYDNTDIYYLDDSYKILKSIQWKIEEPDRKILQQILLDISPLVSRRYQQEIYNMLLLYHSETRPDLIRLVKKQIGNSVDPYITTEEINRKMSVHMETFIPKISEQSKRSIYDKLTIGYYGSKPISDTPLPLSNSVLSDVFTICEKLSITPKKFLDCIYDINNISILVEII